MKKSQSALEFLTTYGWAFMVILIMIGALAYFGVLNPSKYLPDKCMVSGGFGCPEVVSIEGATSNAIKIRLVNGGAKILTLAANPVVTVSGSIGCTSITGVRIAAVDWTANTYDLDPNEDVVLYFDCNVGLVNEERINFMLKTNYTELGSTFAKPLDITVQTRPD